MLKVMCGDAVEKLKELGDNSVQCCVTSPPYWGLRDYGVDGQIGLEQTPEAYIEKLVAVFREVRRVLKDDGTLWCNIGDSYAGGATGSQGNGKSTLMGGKATQIEAGKRPDKAGDGIKPKDLCGIPWRVAFALQADGWWLRQDIIWCLSGGTWLYVWTEESGECLMTIKDLYRIRGSNVLLWNGYQWTRMLGMSQSRRKGDELEIVLRSGERIACTPTHKFPTVRGLLEASEIRRGDILQRCHFQEPYPKRDHALDCDAAWFCGLYIAEGSRAGDTIQISGHAKEEARWQRVKMVAAKYGGYATRTLYRNGMDIRVYGKVLNAIVDEFVTGRTAHDKGFSPSVWRYSNAFIEAMMHGYLSGDGHWEPDNKRWRLGFCRNYNLERDMRTACARLGWHLVLKLSTVAYKGKRVGTFRGELREGRSGHWNQKDTAEVIEIRKAKCRNVYDIGVCHESHLFALASGILTHNSKPNPMPESVTDRCTKAHEYIFLLTKSARYFYDAEAIKEPLAGEPHAPGNRFHPDKISGPNDRNGSSQWETSMDKVWGTSGTRNKRSVWTVPSSAYSEAHFATFPPDLIKPCILAGSKSGDTILDPFGGSGTTGMVAIEANRKAILIELNPEYVKLINKRCNTLPILNQTSLPLC